VIKSTNKNALIGIVVIGRNEGERLVRCLQSLHEHIASCVYVDSASTDNSLELAKKLGVHTLALDMSKPFTAARARNAGFYELLVLYPQLEFVQFVDGDCEVLNHWLEKGVNYLQNNPKVAVVSGVLNERFPNKSIYNKLCDIEWKMPVGEVKSCGGNALMRVSAFKESGGFLPNLIAGEEPELCVRLRKNGWKVWHLGEQMMLHDANMMNFRQWWKRTIRAGYAFAEGAKIHGAAPEFHWVLESRRAQLWGVFIPFTIIILALLKPIWAILLLLIYPLQWLRLTLRSPFPIGFASIQAFFLLIGKFAELIGQIKFFLHRHANRQSKIIEYK
jgi:GT2 family glycosyltransferase